MHDEQKAMILRWKYTKRARDTLISLVYIGHKKLPNFHIKVFFKNFDIIFSSFS